MSVMDWQLIVLLTPTVGLVVFGLVDYYLNTKGGVTRSRRNYGRDGLRDYPVLHYGWAGSRNVCARNKKRRRPSRLCRWLVIQDAVKTK